VKLVIKKNPGSVMNKLPTNYLMTDEGKFAKYSSIKMIKRGEKMTGDTTKNR
jgi:hypothetical protein